MREIWVDIVGYEGLYQVSNQGRIYSLITHKVLKQTNHDRGYKTIILCKNGVHTKYYIHRLVASHFIYFVPQDGVRYEVNHKDEDKANNRADNLEFITPSANINYGTRNERNIKTSGTKVLCVETGIVYDSIRDAARKLGLNPSHIVNCCKGKYGYKTHGGYQWRYFSKKEDASNE